MKQTTYTIEDVYRLFNLFSDLSEEQTKLLIDDAYSNHRNSPTVCKQIRYMPSDFDIGKPVFGFSYGGYIRGYDWSTHRNVKTSINEYTALYIESLGETNIKNGTLEVVYVSDSDSYNRYHNGLILLDEYNSRVGAIYVEDIVINFKSFCSILEITSSFNKLEKI